MVTETPAPRVRKLRSRAAYPRRKKRTSGVGKFFLLTGIVLASCLGVLIAHYLPLTALDWRGLAEGRDPKEVLLEALGSKLDSSYQVLVMGVDRVEGAPPGSKEVFNGRTDTIMLLNFDPQGKITLLSIPRDTQVTIPGVGIAKINAANVYGGIGEAKATLKETLQGVRIDRYVRIDTTGLAAIIDAIGGVEVNVPERMFYEDKTQGLKIDLYPGLQVLNGKQAEGFSRFRGDSAADIGRIKRQQVLLQAIQKKLGTPLTLLRLRALIDVFHQYVDTDLTLEEMTTLASFSLSLPPNSTETLTLPGHPSDPQEYLSSYWITEPEEIHQTIGGKFLRESGE